MSTWPIFLLMTYFNAETEVGHNEITEQSHDHDDLAIHDYIFIPTFMHWTPNIFLMYVFAF